MFDEIKLRFRFSIIFSLLILFIFIFEPTDSPNLADSVLLGALFFIIIVSYLIVLIASLTCLLKFKKIGWKSFVPLCINAVAILFMFFVPIGEFKKNLKFSKNKDIYNKIVIEVLNGKKFPVDGICVDRADNTSFCSVNISNEYPNITTENRIIIEKIENKAYILFYDFVGLKDNYSGFLYVADGGDPKRYDDAKLKIKFIEKNWYYVSY
jgi:uncharacterized membrane protein